MDTMPTTIFYQVTSLLILGNRCSLGTQDQTSYKELVTEPYQEVTPLQNVHAFSLADA